MNRSQELKKIYESFVTSFSIRPSGEIVEQNMNFKLLFNGKDIPTSIYDLVSGQFNQDYHNRMIDHVLKGFPWRDEIRFSFGDVLFWLDVQMSPLKTEDGLQITYVGIDLTSRKRNEDLIKEQQKQIFTQSQFSALGEMASGVAHEINNPLTILSASAFYLKDMAEGPEIDQDQLIEISQDVEQTVNRISNIIQGLRNIARDPSKEEFSVKTFKEIIDDVLPICSEKFKSAGIELQLDFGKGLDLLPLRILPIQVSQIILNLLNNSYDEIKEKSIPNPWVLIRLSLDNDQSKFQIEVRDSGKGIPKAIQDSIFNPFYTQKEIGKGTGLGLSLSKSMAERHKGKLEIDNSCPNTSFKLTLPYRRSFEQKEVA